MQIWQPNQTIKDSRFLIQKKLGIGGFGITYLAEDRQKQQRVVIKTLNANRQDAPDFKQIQEKFVNEALKLSQFRHPHIVRVQELIQEGDLWGIVMEYIDGVELSDCVLEREKLEEAEALAYIDKIAQALDYVHQQGVLHRDVKPHNIMLRQIDRYPILIDFGLAREFIDGKSLSMTNSLTHGYAPPEQYDRHGKFGTYTDVYALAATLYHLLTGQTPIPANYRQYPNVNLTTPKDYDSGITDRVSDAIMQGMAIDFRQRPQNMTEFRKLLGLVSKSVSAKSKPVATPAPSPQSHQKFSFETAQIKIVDGFFGKKVKIVKQTKQGEYISEDLGIGVKLEMVSIPAGSFLMGSPAGEGHDNERPQHLVNVPAFYIGKYPISQSQYLIIMGENPSRFQGGELPVEKVSWLEAQVFCEKLSQKTGRTYRLPSEAEWEYACRAGTTTPFAFGETITPEVVNYNGTYPYGGAAKGEFRGKTTPVGSLPANRFGVNDMHGNVWEWCLDEWVDNHNGAPTDGSARGNISSRDENINRLVRGGSWKYAAFNCRSANRNSFAALGRSSCISFRVVWLPSKTS